MLGSGTNLYPLGMYQDKQVWPHHVTSIADDDVGQSAVLAPVAHHPPILPLNLQPCALHKDP